MLVNQAKPQDVAKIVRIFSVLDFPAYHVSNRKGVVEAIQEQRIFVAKRNGGIIGAMKLDLPVTDSSLEIQTIAAERGSGAGRALIDYAEEICKTSAIPKMWAWSMDRYNAKGFYKKMGFSEEHLMKGQFFGEDCWLFGKHL